MRTVRKVEHEPKGLNISRAERCLVRGAASTRTKLFEHFGQVSLMWWSGVAWIVPVLRLRVLPHCRGVWLLTCLWCNVTLFSPRAQRPTFMVVFQRCCLLGCHCLQPGFFRSDGFSQSFLIPSSRVRDRYVDPGCLLRGRRKPLAVEVHEKYHSNVKNIVDHGGRGVIATPTARRAATWSELSTDFI